MTDIDLAALSVDELERLRRRIDDELARRRNTLLKPGDRVRHRCGYFGGVGTVVEVSKTGKSVIVEFWTSYGRYLARYNVGKLERVR